MIGNRALYALSPVLRVAGGATTKPKVSLVLGKTSIDESGSGNATTVKATVPSAVSAAVTVRLGSSPTGKVSFGAATVTIPSGGTESPTTTVTAVDNDVDAPDATVAITGSTASTAVTAPDDVSLTVTDDDTKGVTLSATNVSVNEGGNGTYTVKLDSEPTASVVVTPASGDAGAVTVSTAASGNTLTFTTANWSTAQTVTVAGVQDADSTDESVTVTHAVSGAGSGYESVTAASVTVAVDDDETSGDTTAPGKPSALALASGTSSPGNDATPSVEVTVTEAGGKVTLYSDSACTSAASAATSVTDTSSPYKVTVDATALTADGAVTFHAKHADAANNASDCSTASVAYTYDGTRPGIELPTARPQESVASTITLTDATAKVRRYGAIEVLGNETTGEPCDTPSEIGSALQTETPPATPVSLSYTPTSGSVGKLLCVYVEDAAGNRRSALWTTAVAALTPPAPPSLSADTPAANTIRLIWSWSRFHGRPDAWVIEVSEDAGATWTELAVPTAGELYRHTGLAAGAVRHYRVKARNTVGGVNRDSGWSPVASATALDPNAPARPTGFTGRGVDRGAKLTWDNPNDATITGYEYRQDPGGGFGPWTAIPGSGAGTTTYTVTGLSPGLTYAFQLRAVKGTLKGVPSISTRVRPTGSVAPGTLTVPWDWAHLPKGADGSPAFTDGQSFRLLFMTLGQRDATSNDIAEYNRFVQAGAPTAGTRALISTRNVHAQTTPRPRATACRSGGWAARRWPTAMRTSGTGAGTRGRRGARTATRPAALCGPARARTVPSW